jgi:uncharacterized membrane protein YhaH (DUF805 family)
MLKLIPTLFSFSGYIDRGRYFAIALTCVLLKHIVDVTVATHIFHRAWTFPNYFLPLGIPIAISDISRSEATFLASMLAIAIPFGWIGLAITTKRFHAIGWPAWAVLFFFVPIANIVSFAIATITHDRTPGDAATTTKEALIMGNQITRIVPEGPFSAAVFALLGTTLVSLLFAWVDMHTWRIYGWGMFAAIPFIQGTLAVLAFGAHKRRSLGQSIAIGMASLTLTGVVMLCIAFEGLVCLMMAMPFMYAFGFLGILFGHMLHGRFWSSGINAAMLLVLLVSAPVMIGAEGVLPRETPTYAVRTKIVINAPADVVWQNVIGFTRIPPPTEMIFRIGVAYPKQAKLVGHGVGAIRYCQFSTGDFIEPITTWNPDHRLAFNVIKNPEPMQEWTPYGHIDTPHLHGYMLSRHGEFDLETLQGGKTLLTGTTWYQHHLWPAPYWRIWSDGIIHQIHWRVLTHIKKLAENEPHD